MRVSLSSLQSFFSSPLSIKQIIDACDRIGIETEVETLPSSLPTSIVTAKIVATQPHPNADRLTVATLFDGEKEHQVVCGATNCRPDIIIPLALPGAKLTDQEGNTYTIKKSKLRGVESNGMCCGADEIGFSHLQSSSHGLYEFPLNTPLGENACSLLADTFIECSLTPNLGHCASLLGLAREISFVTDVELVIPQEFSFEPLATQEIQQPHHDVELAPVFYCVKISGVAPIPSPKELQDALGGLKQKPINALVDITNYIMLALGQPLHAYDATQVDINSLRAQFSSEDQQLKLLNQEEVFIPKGTAVICDDQHVVALAGVMGSLDSACNENTSEIILEAAYFLPKAIRASQSRVPMHSEAAYRFTRGVNAAQVLNSLYAAIHYIQQFFPQATISPIRIVGSLPQPSLVNVRTHVINRTLNQSLTDDEVQEKLSSLGFETHLTEEGVLAVRVPYYRHDIREEIDLVEEVFRVCSWQTEHPKAPATYSPMYALKRQITDFLSQSGLQQFFTCDLLDLETSALNREDPDLICLQGSKQSTSLRNSLLSGLLKSTATNLNRQAPYVHAFEIGTVYSKKETKYQETQSLAIIMAGQSEELSWFPTKRELSFYAIKGWVEKILHFLHVSPQSYTIQAGESANFHPYQQAEIYLHKQLLGRLGTLHPQLCKKAQIKQNVFFAELSLDLLLPTQKKSIRSYKPYPLFPSSFRDITLTVPESLPAETLRKKLLSFSSKWLESVSIISIYQDKNSNTQSKNVSLRLVYRDKEKTLSNQEIEKEHERLITLLHEQINAT